MAPELLAKRTDYSVTVDLWAVGCIMFHMMTGRFLCPYTQLSHEEESLKALKNQVSIFGISTFEESKLLINFPQELIFPLDQDSIGLNVIIKKFLIKD